MKDKVQKINLESIRNFCPFKYGKGLPKSNRNKNGSIPVYGSGGIDGYHDDMLTKGPTIIIGRKGTVGSVYYSEIPCWPIDTTFFISNMDKNDLKFIFYLLQTFDLEGKNSDTAVPGLNREVAHDIKFSLPSKEDRKKIGCNLWNFDNQIKLLGSKNKILEQIIQTYFKSWFIDFDEQTEFDDSELKQIPKGWTLKQLDEIANFRNGLALQKFRPLDNASLPVIKIREMKQGFTENSEKASTNIKKEYIIQNGDILFSWSASLEVMIWGFGKGALNQHIFKVTSDEYEKWFYYMWIKFHLDDFRNIAKDKATTMGHIKKEHLSDAQVLVPLPKTLELMNNVINPLFNLILQNKILIQNLKKIRDTLLPILISDETKL